MSRDLTFGTCKRALFNRTFVAGVFVLAATAVSQAQSFGFASFNALVGANGVLVRSSGVSSSLLTGTGLYKLTFTRPINSCVYSATISSGFPGFIAVNVNNAQPTVLVARTFSTAGAAKSFPFDVVISCAS